MTLSYLLIIILVAIAIATTAIVSFHMDDSVTFSILVSGSKLGGVFDLGEVLCGRGWMVFDWCFY